VSTHTTKGRPVKEKARAQTSGLHMIEGGGGAGDDGAAGGRSDGAVYLCEALSLMNEGAGFLDRLRLDEIAALRRVASPMSFEPGESIFVQGDLHSGILLIEEGRVRIYYAGPSGKEITLAYWPPGHFIGGPEVFGGGVHMWSAVAVEPSRLSYLPAGKLRRLASTVPAIALALIDGLVAKGKCYSALVQMLGTRSVTERLAQLLLVLASADSADLESGVSLVVDRRITHEQLATIVGSTRQWVTSTLARFQREKIIRMERNVIYIDRPEALPLQS
jgi:CRP/FNR family cyclic AMP-dependent transcriptional regulator